MSASSPVASMMKWAATSSDACRPGPRTWVRRCRSVAGHHRVDRADVGPVPPSRRPRSSCSFQSCAPGRGGAAQALVELGPGLALELAPTLRLLTPPHADLGQLKPW